MKSETPQEMASRLKFEYDASQNMDGILYQDENREPEPKLTTDKIVQKVSVGSVQIKQNEQNTCK